jgi:hypothetical protein
VTAVVDLATVQGLLSGWWFDYDQGTFDTWPAYFTADAHFACGSDSGATDFEDFISADVRGGDEVVAWQTRHRRDSPYPLRHFATNVHVVATRPDEADFRSYLFCTQIVGMVVSNLASGIVRGTVRVEDGAARFAELRVKLDFTDSVTFTDATLFALD